MNHTFTIITINALLSSSVGKHCLHLHSVQWQCFFSIEIKMFFITNSVILSWIYVMLNSLCCYLRLDDSIQSKSTHSNAIKLYIALHRRNSIVLCEKSAQKREKRYTNEWARNVVSFDCFLLSLCALHVCCFIRFLVSFFSVFVVLFRHYFIQR